MPIGSNFHFIYRTSKRLESNNMNGTDEITVIDLRQRLNCKETLIYALISQTLLRRGAFK